jgi:hypothetical protein
MGRKLRTADNLRKEGFLVQLLYVGPFELERACKIIDDLALKKFPSGEYIFDRLILVSQDDKFNVAEVQN